MSQAAASPLSEVSFGDKMMEALVKRNADIALLPKLHYDNLSRIFEMMIKGTYTNRFDNPHNAGVVELERHLKLAAEFRQIKYEVSPVNEFTDDVTGKFKNFEELRKSPLINLQVAPPGKKTLYLTNLKANQITGSFKQGYKNPDELLYEYGLCSPRYEANYIIGLLSRRETSYHNVLMPNDEYPRYLFSGPLSSAELGDKKVECDSYLFITWEGNLQVVPATKITLNYQFTKKPFEGDDWWFLTEEISS